MTRLQHDRPPTPIPARTPVPPAAPGSMGVPGRAPRPRALHSLHGLCSTALLTLSLLGGCGGGGTNYPPVADTTPIVAVVPTTTTAVTVEMPSGVSLGADKLSVVTSIGAATPDASGAVTLQHYANGEQLAAALSPSGSPMMMGWVDTAHTTINAATTAQVLAYFALGGQFGLKSVDREALIADLPTAPGIDAFAAVVSTELAANVDAFADADPALKQAVSDFATPLFTAAHANPAKAQGREHAEEISITPDAQSGITVLQDPPLDAHLSNSFRRRSYAFVDRISHTTDGTVVADPQAVTDFEVPPVVGVNGGVTGALTDIMSAYYGVQPTAYGPIVAPSTGTFSVPLVEGSEKTTYQVTVVGPGLHAGSKASLTAPQQVALTDVAFRGFVKDFLVPTFANAILGSGAIDFTSGLGTPQAKFAADLLASVTTDFIAIIPTVPGLDEKIVAGRWFDAGVDITSTVSGTNTLKSILINGFNKATAAQTPGLEASSLRTMMTKFNVIMNTAGGILQVYDTSVYVADFASSDQADQWSLTVTNQKVALNPSTSKISLGASVTLTASVLGVESTPGYSYHWATTSQMGTLTETNGGGRTLQTDFCSSSPVVTFVSRSADVSGATDTVTVQAYASSFCDTSRGPALGRATATISSDIGVTISPRPTLIAPGTTTTFTGTTQGTLPDGVTYRWVVTGGGSIGSSSTVITTTPTIAYTAQASGTDTLELSVLSPGGAALATDAVTITVRTPSGLSLVATSGSACCGGIGPGTYTTDAVPTGGYGSFAANYAGDPQYGFIVSWSPQDGSGNSVGVSLRLGLPAGTKITGASSWTTYAGILETIQPGQFLFISSTSDNVGMVAITSFTALPGGGHLATFTFTESSTSGSSTRAYSGAGSFIVPG